MTAYEGIVLNGQIRLDNVESLPEGVRVRVILVDGDEDEPEEEIRGITGAEILASGIVGMWADREDITDSAKFAEEIRRRAERRY